MYPWGIAIHRIVYTGGSKGLLVVNMHEECNFEKGGAKRWKDV
jgi:hypothetical protein